MTINTILSSNSDFLLDGWIKLKFEDICENVVERVEIPNESGYEKFIGGDHLDTECLRIKRYGSTQDVNAQKLLFRKGHVLFGKRNAYLRKAAYADFDGVCSAHMMVLKNRPQYIEEKLFPFFIQSKEFWNRANMISEGSMSPTIKWKILAKQEFIIPPKVEQRKIADILWVVEGSIWKKEDLIEKIQLFKLVLMTYLFSKGIRRNRLKNSSLGEVPEGWKVSTIGKSCIVENKYRKPINGKKRAQMKGAYPYYGPTGILDFIDEYRLDGKYVLIGEDGDHFLKHKTWSMTQLVEGKFNVNNHAHILLGKENCLTEWIYYYFRHRDILPYLTRQGSGRLKLNKKTLLELPIVIPPLNEQQKIVDILVKLDKTIDILKNNNMSLIHLKKRLLNDLLSGEKRLRSV